MILATIILSLVLLISLWLRWTVTPTGSSKERLEMQTWFTTYFTTFFTTWLTFKRTIKRGNKL